MNFEFSAEQDMLRDQAAGFLAGKGGAAVCRRVLEGDEPYARDLWDGMAELGWPAVIIPEAHGGIGMGHLELCVLAEELGRALAPVPFASSVYLVTQALLDLGSPAQQASWLPRLATGEVVGCVAVHEGTGDPKAGCRVTDGALSGSKTPVTDGDVADLLVVLATDADGPGLFLVEGAASGVQREAVDTLDPSRSHASLTFDGAACEPLGAAGQGLEALARLQDKAAIPLAFEQVGGAQAALDQAVAYARERYAFGRPIGSFQAIKHKLADVYIANTLARSNCYFGAWALHTGAAELPVAAATARVSATRAYWEASKENIQAHGGMGYTWEFDCHLHYRRAKLLAHMLGSLPRWQERLVSAIEQQN